MCVFMLPTVLADVCVYRCAHMCAHIWSDRMCAHSSSPTSLSGDTTEIMDMTDITDLTVAHCLPGLWNQKRRDAFAFVLSPATTHSIVRIYLYVCMRVCMYVCTYVRMYVCMYIGMCVCVYVCPYALCAYACTYVHMHYMRIKHAVFSM